MAAPAAAGQDSPTIRFLKAEHSTTLQALQQEVAGLRELNRGESRC